METVTLGHPAVFYYISCAPADTQVVPHKDNQGNDASSINKLMHKLSMPIPVLTLVPTIRVAVSKISKRLT